MAEEPDLEMPDLDVSDLDVSDFVESDQYWLDVILSMDKKETKKKYTFMKLVYKFCTNDEFGNWDVSGFFTRKCFEDWYKSYELKLAQPEEVFRKALIQKLTISDGKSIPMPLMLEKAFLKEVRKRQTWGCFLGRTYINEPSKFVNIGSKGTRILGYHEKMEQINNINTF